MDSLIQNISSKASYIQAAQQSQFSTRKQAILDSIERASIKEYIVEIEKFIDRISNLYPKFLTAEFIYT